MGVRKQVDLERLPSDPTPADYHRLAREIGAVDAGDLSSLRLGLLSSATLDFLRPALIVEGARRGLAIDTVLGPFGQLEQPVMGDGPLYEPQVDVLVLLFQPDEIAPDAFDRFYESRGERLESLCEELSSRLLRAARRFRDDTGHPVLVANYATPLALPLGPFDAADPKGVTHRLARHNALLAKEIDNEPDLYLWDYAGLVRESGATRWIDPRLRALARVPVSAECQPRLARHLLRTVMALRHRPAKCLVLDLDNTLWGGVVGDDGLAGLQLGDDWPGKPFKDLQRAALGLRDRGILLAVASKNDREVAEEAFQQHPDMLIRWDELAAVRINWEPKSANLRSIAEELNIGADALVLFDDNPVERAEVRANLPEARVIEVPSDPTDFRTALLQSGHFDQLALSDEDRGRAEMYRVDRARRTFQKEAPTLEEFLETLEMKARVGAVGEHTLARVSQLVGRTNQFNLTTRRHSSATIAEMSESDDYYVGWLRLRDRFGDQGIVAVGIIERRDDTAWLDTFLMSCRVMNRDVEHAMMAHLMNEAIAMGCERMVGEYIPTPKNHIVETLLSDMGFSLQSEKNGATIWEMSLPEDPHEDLWPPHLQREPTEAAATPMDAAK